MHTKTLREFKPQFLKSFLGHDPPLPPPIFYYAKRDPLLLACTAFKKRNAHLPRNLADLYWNIL